MPRCCNLNLIDWTRSKLDRCCNLNLIDRTRSKLDRLSRSRLLPEVPYLVYLTDIKVVFIMTTVYTSLVSQFRSSALSETERDISSGILFKINDEWINHSIEGGVSDSILWQCRRGSDSRNYYQLLYGGLLGIFLSVVTVYFIFRLTIVILIYKRTHKIKYPIDNMNVSYLVVIGNSLKKLYQLKKKLFENKELEEVKEKALIDRIQKEWQSSWEYNISGSNRTHTLVKWVLSLYVIPMFENFSVLLLLLLVLTSYDIHPMGCLLYIDVKYDDVENTVSLVLSEVARNYQKVAVVLAVVVCMFWICLKLMQRCLLADANGERAAVNNAGASELAIDD